jgi:hypothetical protein
MLKSGLKYGSAGLALAASLAMTTPAFAQLGGVTGQLGGTVNSTTRTTTDLQTKTRLEREADLERAKAKADLENQTDLSNQTEATADIMGNANGQLGENAATNAAADAALDATSQTDLSHTTRAGAAIDGSSAIGATASTMDKAQTRVETTGAAVQNRTDIRGETSGSAQTGTAVRVNTPSSVRVGVSSPVSVGVQSHHNKARYTGQSGVHAETPMPSSSVSGMLTVGTTVMSQSGAMLGTINGFQTTDAGIVSAVTLDGQAKAVPVSALSAKGDVLVSSMSEAKIK